MDKDILFLKGIENHRFFIREDIKRINLHELLFLILLIFFSRRKHYSGCIGWVNGNRGYEKLFRDYSDVQLVFHGKHFVKLRNFINKNSVLSGFSRGKRILLFINATIHYIKYRKHLLNYVYYIEFTFVYFMLTECNINKIMTTGIYDRVTTWMSYFSKEYQLDFEIIAHGIISEEDIPSKIYATKIYVFCDNQIKFYRKFIISNKECIFERVEYVSLIDFEDYNSQANITFAVISQLDPKWVSNIVEDLLKLNINREVLIMMHPLDHPNMYKSYNKIPGLKIENRRKYINMDYVITKNSTIVLDYLAHGYSGKIIQIDDKLDFGFELTTDRIIHFDSPENFLVFIKNDLNSNNLMY